MLCHKSHREIFEDIQEVTIPSDALVRNCRWHRIRQIRRGYFNLVNADGLEDPMAFVGARLRNGEAASDNSNDTGEENRPPRFEEVQ